MFKFLFGTPKAIETDTFSMNFKVLTKDNYKDHLSHGSMIMFSKDLKAGNFGVVRVSDEDIDKATVCGMRIKTVMSNFARVILMYH